MTKYYKCCNCGKFMRKVLESWTEIGIEIHYECKCGGYEIHLEE